MVECVDMPKNVCNVISDTLGDFYFALSISNTCGIPSI